MDRAMVNQVHFRHYTVHPLSLEGLLLRGEDVIAFPYMVPEDLAPAA